MNPTEQAARWLADCPVSVDGHGASIDYDDATAAIARHLAPGDDLVERIAEPHDPGDFVGDIYFGHPVKTTMGTHRWSGSEWVALPSEAEALAGLLADARAETATLRDRLARMEGAIEPFAREGNGVLRNVPDDWKITAVDMGSHLRQVHLTAGDFHRATAALETPADGGKHE